MQLLPPSVGTRTRYAAAHDGLLHADQCLAVVPAQAGLSYVFWMQGYELFFKENRKIPISQLNALLETCQYEVKLSNGRRAFIDVNPIIVLDMKAAYTQVNDPVCMPSGEASYRSSAFCSA